MQFINDELKLLFYRNKDNLENAIDCTPYNLDIKTILKNCRLNG
jgi:hypothetical protein